MNSSMSKQTLAYIRRDSSETEDFPSEPADMSSTRSTGDIIFEDDSSVDQGQRKNNKVICDLNKSVTLFDSKSLNQENMYPIISDEPILSGESLRVQWTRKTVPIIYSFLGTRQTIDYIKTVKLGNGVHHFPTVDSEMNNGDIKDIKSMETVNKLEEVVIEDLKTQYVRNWQQRAEFEAPTGIDWENAPKERSFFELRNMTPEVEKEDEE